MSAAEHMTEEKHRASGRAKPPKWRYIYFLLAAFDLVTVSGGLYLNHKVMEIYTRSVAVNRVWAERVAAYAHMEDLATAVNAPGNDVFDSRKIDDETIKMRVAEQTFDLDLARQRMELQANVEPRLARPLLALFDTIAAAKKEMTDEALRIFGYFRQGRPDLAGERMATMDHKFAYMHAALAELQRAVGAIQEQNFKDQTAVAAGLQQFEYLIGLSILLMVLGATYYGHKLARDMQADAEQRERSFDALREADARTRSILDTAAEGIITFDAQGQLESCNKAAERLFDRHAADAIGCDVSLMVPALAKCADPVWAGDGATGASAEVRTLSGEGLGRRRDGTEFPVEFAVSKTELGRGWIFTGIIRDISDRRQAEAALRIAATAQAANRAKSQFLANVSHEIRTPMYAVLGMAEMLLDTNLTQTQRRFAESVHRSGESLLRIIDDILDFSKIEAGKLELECVDFKPRALIDEVMQLLLDGAQRKGLELVHYAQENVPDTLRGAPSRLRQVLINLVGNAIKFTDRGSVTVKVSLIEAGSANVEAYGDYTARSAFAATKLLISITDTGIGIAPTEQERLFHAFEQADNSTTRRYGGTGLGLSISKELVEKMGGQIGVRSALGQGAEFWFTLPAVVPQAAGAAFALDADGARRAGGLNGVRVLLAEDNPISQDVARAMLNSLGCQVHVADNGAKVLAALEQSQFDIVLMDRQMPVMDGFDATAEIRARRLLRPQQPQASAEPVRLPIVGLTASALAGDREICIAAGMDDYLSKPFRRDALRIILERWVLDRDSGPIERTLPAERASISTFDPGSLEQMRLQQHAGAPRIMAGLIDGYFADAAGLIESISRACTRSDRNALARAAHSFGVSSDFVGARKLAGMCRELEREAPVRERAELEQRVARIREEYQTVRSAMEAARPGNRGACAAE